MKIGKKKQRKRQNKFLFLVISIAFLLVFILFMWQRGYLFSLNEDNNKSSQVPEQTGSAKINYRQNFSYDFFLFKSMEGVKNAGFNLNTNPVEIYLTLKKSFNVEKFISSLQKILKKTDAKIISWKSLASPTKSIKIFITMNNKDLLLKVGWKDEKVKQIIARNNQINIRSYANPVVKRDNSVKVIIKKNLRKNPQVAIVLDDAGGEGSLQWRFLKLNAKMTFAVMPHLPNSIKFSRRAHAKGYGVILHAPMMPRGSSKEAIPQRIIKAGMTRGDVFRMLAGFFKQVPFARGMNNHMGSLATSNEKLMGFVMSYLSSKKYFFFDSFTHATSIAYRSALKQGIKGYRRDVFIDHHRDYKYIENSLYKLAKLAVAKGFAIGIGHVTSLNTYKVLKVNIPKIKKLGIKFVFLKGSSLK